MIPERIRERFYRREPVFSFEFFPPKTAQGEADLRLALRHLAPLAPTFVSVTYGAGGATRHRTREIVCSLQREYGFAVMAHVACLGHSHAEVRRLLEEYAAHGIRNILALRRDPPRSATEWQPVMGGPQHAIEVVKIAAEMGCFAIGVAGYPEKHPEAPSLAVDIERLRDKVAAGADFVITQIFFDNDVYFDFVQRARRAGVKVPILPGVMPVTRVGQIERFHQLCGCTIPQTLVRHLAACGSDEARVQEVGLAYCAAQCADLLR
ncbi:MAG: methylenetetrahydrofolate reductase, partial [Planctomycetota bacterium]|nr:methylenetetrahydrofolate reductase [Planctomycetota bacterium]